MWLILYLFLDCFAQTSTKIQVTFGGTEAFPVQIFKDKKREGKKRKSIFRKNERRNVKIKNQGGKI